MKLGIVGKGGVGKTTLSALIAQEYAERGHRVLAIDTDSNPNLAISLGLDAEQADDIPLLPRRWSWAGRRRHDPGRADQRVRGDDAVQRHAAPRHAHHPSGGRLNVR